MGVESRQPAVVAFLEAVKRTCLLYELLFDSYRQMGRAALFPDLLRTLLAFWPHLERGSFEKVCASGVAPSLSYGVFAMIAEAEYRSYQMIARMIGIGSQGMLSQEP
jgi:hypothetical protein